MQALTPRVSGPDPGADPSSHRRFLRGKVRRRRRQRTLWGTIALALVVVLVLGALGAGSSYVALKTVGSLQTRVAADFREGQSQLEAGKAALKQATQTGNVAFIDAADTDISSARKAFSRARSEIAGYPLFGPAESVPGIGSYVGRRTDAVLKLSEMGTALCDAAQTGAAIDRQLIAKSATGGQAGPRLITLLKQVEPQLASVRTDLERAGAAAAAVDPSVLPAGQGPALTLARNSIASGLSSLGEFTRLVPVLYEVLGANGPRNYLLEQLNAAELRPGGGFFGTYSLLHIDAGTVTVLQSGQTFQLNYPRAIVGQPGYIEPPGPLRSLISGYSWSIQDSNFFTNFPENAQAALSFSKTDFSVPVNGVISMDFYTVIDLLTVTGPITVAGSTQPVDANNFIPTVIALGDFGNAGGPAKEFVSALAAPLMRAVMTLPPEKLTTLLTALNANASGRHLQAYFVDKPAEAEMNRIGWSGAPNPTGAKDFMAEVEGNYGGTKANYYVTRTYEVALSRSGANLHHHVVVSLVNRTPQSIPNNYYCYTRLLVPPESTGVGSGGLAAGEYPDTYHPPGSIQINGWVNVVVERRTGLGTALMTFDYDTPFTTDANGEHQIYWQKQAGTVADAITVTWSEGSIVQRATSTLAQDVVIRISPHGLVLQPGQAGSAHLPSLTL